MTNTMIILNTLALASLLLYALMQRSARRQDAAALAQTRSAWARERQRAHVYKILIDKHVASRDAYLHEMQQLERRYTYFCVRRHQRTLNTYGYRRLSFPTYSRTTVN
jgi:hypothetical protein